MTHDVVLRPTRGRRRPWLLFPLLSVLILVVGWLALWLLARREAEAGMDRWFALEAARGRQWTCPDRQISGFPLSISLSCSQPTFKGKLGNEGLDARMTGFVAEAYLYQPNAVEARLAGPITIRQDGQPGETVVSWSALALTLRLMIDGRARAAFVADGLELALPDGSKPHADHAELHIAPVGAGPIAEASYDIVLGVAGAAIPAVDDLAGNQDPLALDVKAAVGDLALDPSLPWPVLAEQWRAAGGRIDLATLTLAKGGLRIGAQGQLGIDDMHRPTGRLQTSLAGYETFAAKLGLPLRAVSFGGALANILGRNGAPAPDNEADGKSVSMPIMLADGRVVIGPFKTSLRLPPLY